MKIALAGNPNSGKTTLYNALTGKQEYVGNWAGVTVSKKEAKLKESLGNNIDIVDLPGAYSIRPYTSEESITTDFIKTENPDVIINVVDSTNLNRSLFFTTQLLELNIPVVVALNKVDISKNVTDIDVSKLEKELNCKVVEISAAKNEGLKNLINVASESSKLKEQKNLFKELSNIHNEEKQDKKRYSIVNNIISKVENRIIRHNEETLEDKIDRFVTNPIIGTGLFILIMAFIFDLSINTLGPLVADALVGFIENFQNAVSGQLASMGTSDFLNSLLTDGIIGGVGAVVGFVPLVMVLMFMLSLVEDSGFMARIALIFDPLFRKIGLSGRSIVPLLIGFGCTVPAVMSTRTLPSERDRKMTILLTPFMSCTAKLPIYAFFVNAFFPKQGGLVMTGLYVLGIVTGVLVAFLFKNTLFKGEAVPFVMELPNYRLPGLKNVSQLLWEKAKDFLQKAFTVIFVATVLVWFLQSFNLQFDMVKDSSQSILAMIAGWIAPVFAPLGLQDWRIVTSLISGFMAKESVVSTLQVLFVGGLHSALTTLSAASLLVFCLIYSPCVAAIASIKRELGARWAVGVVAWQCVLAWILAFVVHVIGSVL